MRIAYGKLGRSYNLDIKNASVAGGDIDVVRGLYRLATRFPEAEILLLGRNSGEQAADVGLPSNVRNLWAEEPLKSIKVEQYKSLTPHLEAAGIGEIVDSLDHYVLWLGQHGTSNTEGGLPMIDDRTRYTDPQSSSVVYCGYLLEALNRWRDTDPLTREEIWLCPDPRNYVKCRDNKWPLRHPVIAQYEQRRKTKHERYGDPSMPLDHGFMSDRAWYDADEPGLWKSHVDYAYGALELTALPMPGHLYPSWVEALDAGRVEFGLISNENRANVSRPRANLVKSWIVDKFPEAPIYGIWSEKGQEALGREVGPVPYTAMLPTMRAFRASCTFPASGSFWATAKPWEAFACGTIMFFHPDYDKQNHILRDAPAELREYLRVDSPEMLVSRVHQVGADFAFYRELATMQWNHFCQRFEETQGGMKMLYDRVAG